MTRSELIQIVSSRQGQLSEKNTEKIVKDIFNQMAEALGAGHRIEIRGFPYDIMRHVWQEILKPVNMFLRKENIPYILNPAKICGIGLISFRSVMTTRSQYEDKTAMGIVWVFNLGCFMHVSTCRFWGS